MKIAVIGSGISGLLAAYLLGKEHEVHLLEAGIYLGGHTNTIEVTIGQTVAAVDTGFMVFNRQTYPHFCQLLQQIGIQSQASDMSFSVRCDQTGLEYEGSSLNGLFAQRLNLLRPRFYRILWDILRFNRLANEYLQTAESSANSTLLTLGEFVRARGFGLAFVDNYLIPMGAAIWSARPDKMLAFPARFILGFYKNHGLLQISNRPVWQTIPGGARRYVTKLTEPLQGRVRLSSPVTKVARQTDGVLVSVANQPAENFDHAILATHADTSLQILADATPTEREILSAFPYQRNEVVVHTDTSVLPRSRRAWASWNYLVPKEGDGSVAVTYDLTRLQKVASPKPILATLNYSHGVDPAQVLQTIEYQHPVFGTAAIAAHGRHGEISGPQRTHFCGAYWGAGFHEDGVRSALAVTKYFGKSLDSR